MWILKTSVLWILSQTLFGFTFETPTECQHIDGNMSVEDDLSFLFIGETVNLTCTLDTNTVEKFSAENFSIRVKKCDQIFYFKNLDLVKDKQSVQIKVEDSINNLPCHQTFLDYVCGYEVKEDVLCILEQRKLVYFDYRPTSVENFTCLVDNWLNMTCWLDMGVAYRQWNKTSFNTVQITAVAGMMGYTMSVAPSDIQRNGSVVAIHISRDKMHLIMFEIRINISNIARGVHKESCFKFDPKTFVKPDPIIDLSLTSNATTISLKWSHSNTQMSKKFRVCYQSEYATDQTCKGYIYEEKDPVTSFNRSQYSLTATNEYRMTLENLWPYTNYSIAIDVRPLIYSNQSETGFWSDKYRTSHRTSEDVPVDVPKLLPGYFTQKNNQETIQFYWQPISRRDRCGVIQSYRATIIDVVEHGEEENRTVLSNISPQSLSYGVSLDPATKYQILLTQRTSVGYPKKADSHIYIFPKDMRPVLADGFNVQAITNTTVELEWNSGFIEENSSKDLTKLATYHIVWCKKDVLYMGECLEPIHSKIIKSENVSSYTEVIKIEGGHYTNYQFGISVEAVSFSGWFISSGIRWFTECIYLKDGVPLMPVNFEIPQDVDQEDGIYIKWSDYTCQQSLGKVQSYIVTFCTTDKDFICQGKLENKTLQPWKTSETLKDLVRGQTYVVQVRARMENGQDGPWSRPERVLYKSITTVEHTKTDIMAGVIAGTVFMIIFISIFLGCFIKKRMEEAYEDVRNINLPPITVRNTHDQIQSNDSDNDAKESREPLLNKDSGIGESTNCRNSINLKYPHYNGVEESQNKIIQQNCNYELATEVDENSKSTKLSSIETSFTDKPDTLEINSEGYNDVGFQSSSDESNDEFSDNTSEDNRSNISDHRSTVKKKTSVQKHCDADNKAFQKENGDIAMNDTGPIDSHCIGDDSSHSESKDIDSYNVIAHNSSSSTVQS